MGEKGGSAAVGAGSGGVGSMKLSGGRRKSAKRMTLRVIEPSPVLRGRALLDGGRRVRDGLSSGLAGDGSEGRSDLTASGGSANRQLAASPLSLSFAASDGSVE